MFLLIYFLFYFVFPFNLQEKLSNLKDICCSSGRNQNWTHSESDIILWSLTAWQGRWAPTAFIQETKIGDFIFFEYVSLRGAAEKQDFFFIIFLSLKKACLDWDLVTDFAKAVASNVSSVIYRFGIHAI